MSALSLYRPEFLWALLFLAAVLAIHLLRRQRPRPLDFSTLRFFRESAVAQTRLRRLRRLLLLLVRLGAVAGLALIFARPHDRNDRLSLLRDPGVSLFVWIDETPSMDYADGGAACLARACRCVDSLARLLPLSARLFVYDDLRGEFAPAERSRPFSLHTRHGPARLGRVMSAWTAASGSSSLPCLMLMSDFQQSTTGCLDTLLPGAAAGRPVVCVTLAPRMPWNFSVRAGDVIDGPAGTELPVTIAAQGRRLDSAEVAASAAGIQSWSGKITAAMDDSAAVAVRSSGGLKDPGGCVALAARDPLSFDNRDYFTAGSRSALRVAVIGDRERNAPVAAAFSSIGGGRWGPVLLKEAAEARVDELDSSDLIVVNALGRPSQALDAVLAGRSSARKAVLLAMEADEGNFGIVSAYFARLCRTSKPLTLVKLPAAASLVLPDTVSRLWTGFPRLRSDEAAVYRYVAEIPGTALLRLDNGAPFAAALADADGRSVVLFASPIGVSDADNFCETGFFVPCIDRIARFACRSVASSRDWWLAGHEYRNPFLAAGKSALTFDEAGKFLERWQSQVQVLFRRPGIYRIAPDGIQPYWLTVKADPEESRLTYAEPLPAPAMRRNVVTISEERLIGSLAGGHGFLPAVPWIILALLLLSELFLWERPDAARSALPHKP